MNIFTALALTLVIAAGQPAANVPLAAAAEDTAVAPTLAAVLQMAALDEVFVSFGETVAEAPESQGLPLNAAFLAAWRGAAAQSFAGGKMQADLQQRLADQFSSSELAELAAFYLSTFGQRVSAIERNVQRLSPEAQLSARDEGLALLDDLPGDARRPQQVDEVMTLVSAEIGRIMLGEAMRAMMVSLVMSGSPGDIEVPWEEIDAQLATLLPGLEQEMQMTQRGLVSYAYSSLDDDELNRYLEFLRTDAARRFFAGVGYAVGLVIHDAMSQFGSELAARMKQVSV